MQFTLADVAFIFSPCRIKACVNSIPFWYFYSNLSKFESVVPHQIWLIILAMADGELTNMFIYHHYYCSAIPASTLDEHHKGIKSFINYRNKIHTCSWSSPFTTIWHHQTAYKDYPHICLQTHKHYQNAYTYPHKWGFHGDLYTSREVTDSQSRKGRHEAEGDVCVCVCDVCVRRCTWAFELAYVCRNPVWHCLNEGKSRRE